MPKTKKVAKRTIPPMPTWLSGLRIADLPGFVVLLAGEADALVRHPRRFLSISQTPAWLRHKRIYEMRATVPAGYFFFLLARVFRRDCELLCAI